MRAIYLLDTNIISEGFKKEPNLAVLERLKSMTPLSVISSVTWHELKRGYLKMPDSKRKGDLKNFLYYVEDVFEKIPYDEYAASIHASFRSTLEQKGISIPYPDAQIAAIAIANNMILITRNTKDFAAIPHLMMESWFEKDQ